MMLAAPLFPDTRLVEIHRRLLAFYGRPPEREVWDPLKQFIYSLLSSRTKTEVTFEVVRHLEERFGSWVRLRDAPMRTPSLASYDRHYDKPKDTDHD